MDIVYIRDLRIDTTIGIYDWEREVRQTISIDLEMASDIQRAAESDDIQYALNYKAVAKRIISHVEQSECLLVERLIEEIATLVRDEFSVPWLRLRLSKPGALRGSQDVGIIIERGSLSSTEKGSLAPTERGSLAPTGSAVEKVMESTSGSKT